eukprot:TRINITY_DN1505_c3_g1_i1.p1 TRINITY_DN1505_c3_g1~~TRINITY_DN1505_c3_g1_i1.p1  ORF type:complete len:1428 (+),score=173.84 TRINITY_DN1505_c3_g1_i1:61-4284(+)
MPRDGRSSASATSSSTSSSSDSSSSSSSSSSRDTRVSGRDPGWRARAAELSDSEDEKEASREQPPEVEISAANSPECEGTAAETPAANSAECEDAVAQPPASAPHAQPESTASPLLATPAEPMRSVYSAVDPVVLEPASKKQATDFDVAPVAAVSHVDAADVEPEPASDAGPSESGDQPALRSSSSASPRSRGGEAPVEQIEPCGGLTPQQQPRGAALPAHDIEAVYTRPSSHSSAFTGQTQTVEQIEPCGGLTPQQQPRGAALPAHDIEAVYTRPSSHSSAFTGQTQTVVKDVLGPDESDFSALLRGGTAGSSTTAARSSFIHSPSCSPVLAAGQQPFLAPADVRDLGADPQASLRGRPQDQIVDPQVSESHGTQPQALMAAPEKQDLPERDLQDDVDIAMDTDEPCLRLNSCKLAVLDFRDLSRITVLDVRDNMITQLSNLPPCLLRLDASGNQIGPKLKGLEDCGELTVLNLRRNRLQQLGDGLRGCLSLQHVLLGRNHLRRAHGLEHLCHLQTLDLEHNMLATPAALRPLSLNTQLRSLVLQGNPVAHSAGRRRLSVSNVPEGVSEDVFSKIARVFGAVGETTCRTDLKGRGVCYATFLTAECAAVSAAAEVTKRLRCAATVKHDTSGKRRRVAIEGVPMAEANEGAYNWDCVTISRANPDERLGIRWHQQRGPRANVIMGVSPGSAADRAGMSAYVGCSVTHCNGDSAVKGSVVDSLWACHRPEGLKRNLTLRVVKARTTCSGAVECTVERVLREAGLWGGVCAASTSHARGWESRPSKNRHWEKVSAAVGGRIDKIYSSWADRRSDGQCDSKLSVADDAGCVWDFDFERMRMRAALTGRVRELRPPQVDAEISLLFEEGVVSASKAAAALNEQDGAVVLSKTDPSIECDALGGCLLVAQQMPDCIPLVANLCPWVRSLDCKAMQMRTEPPSAASVLVPERSTEFTVRSPVRRSSSPQRSFVVPGSFGGSSGYSAAGRAEGTLRKIAAHKQREESAARKRRELTMQPHLQHSVNLSRRPGPEGRSMSPSWTSPQRSPARSPSPASPDPVPRVKLGERRLASLPSLSSSAWAEQWPQQRRGGSRRAESADRKLCAADDSQGQLKALEQALRKICVSSHGPGVQIADPDVSAIPGESEPRRGRSAAGRGQQQQRRREPEPAAAANADASAVSGVGDRRPRSVTFAPGVAGAQQAEWIRGGRREQGDEDVVRPKWGNTHSGTSMGPPDVQDLVKRPQRQVKQVVEREPVSWQPEDKAGPPGDGLTEAVAKWMVQFGRDFENAHLALKTLLVLVDAGDTTELLRHKGIVESTGMLKDTEIPAEVALKYGITQEEMNAAPTYTAADAAAGRLTGRQRVTAVIQQVGETKSCLKYIFTLMDRGDHTALADYLAQVKQSLSAATDAQMP